MLAATNNLVSRKKNIKASKGKEKTLKSLTKNHYSFLIENPSLKVFQNIGKT